MPGTLTRVIAFKFPGDVFKAGDVVRFDVSIADRAPEREQYYSHRQYCY
ncbi:MAG: hypothetical protein WKG07_41370 [Hymenobacter sp.]